MADWNWEHAAVEVGVAVVSWFGSALFTAWKFGRSGAKHDQNVKDDYDGKIDALREQMRTSHASYEKAATARNDLLVEQFKESFDGIRRQIDDNKLDTEKHFLRKEDFGDFRKEYREDVRAIFEKLDRIPRQ